MKTILTSLVLVLLAILPASAQLEAFQDLSADSLKSWLQQEEHAYDSLYRDVAYYALDKAVKQGDNASAGMAHDALSFWYYLNYDDSLLDTMIYHRRKQIEYDEKSGDMRLVAQGYMNLSIDYMNSNQLEKAHDAILKSVEMYEDINNEIGLAEAHVNLAKLYNDLNKPDDALFFSEKSLPILTAENDYLMMVDVLFSGFTFAYMELEDYPKALSSIEQCIDICLNNDFGQNEYALIESYNLKAGILVKQEKLPTAEIYFNKAWELGKKVFGEERASTYRYGLGDVYYQQGEFKNALPHLLAGVNVSADLIDFDHNKYKTLSDCYEQLGQYEEALHFRIKYEDLEKQITDDQIANLESEALVKYETDKKDQDLQEQAQVILNKNRVQWLMIGAATLLAILLATLYYYYSRNRRTSNLLLEKNKLIEERNEQNEILLKEIHHRVKNNLQIISSLLNFQSRSIDDQNAKSAILDSQSRVSSMSLIHQKLYRSENLAAVEMKSYLQILSENLIDAYADEEAINVQLDMGTLNLDVDYAIPIGLIVNELVTNSLKYAFPKGNEGAIQIKLHQQNEELVLDISDNGVGNSYQVEKNADGGFGSELVEMLTYQLKGKVAQSSENGYHTQLRFPYADVA